MTQFQLPKLNYDLNALEPELSAETLNYHYNWHHKTYVEKLNQLLPGSGFENQTLDEIVKSATGPLFNNAAQHWNHSFYWRCMKPKAAGKPGVKIGNTLDREFGSFDEFKAKFQKIATEHFGSGWAWLLADSNGKLSVMATHDADNPLHQGKIPLLACDLWEHAYYIDYRSARPDYLKNFWNITNWDKDTRGLAKIIFSTLKGTRCLIPRKKLRMPPQFLSKTNRCKANKVKEATSNNKLRLIRKKQAKAGQNHLGIHRVPRWLTTQE